MFLHCVEYGEALLGDAVAPGAQSSGPCFFRAVRGSLVESRGRPVVWAQPVLVDGLGFEPSSVSEVVFASVLGLSLHVIMRNSSIIL